jgi:hypothetical protein
LLLFLWVTFEDFEKWHNLLKRNAKLILKILSDLEPLRGSSNKKTLYSTRSCVNWAFFGSRRLFKRSFHSRFKLAHSCQKKSNLQTTKYFAVLSRSRLVLTLYLSVSNNCFIFLITNQLMTISLTVYNLFTNIMLKSTFTKHKILEKLIAWFLKCTRFFCIAMYDSTNHFYVSFQIKKQFFADYFFCKKKKQKQKTIWLSNKRKNVQDDK